MSTLIRKFLLAILLTRFINSTDVEINAWLGKRD